MARGDFVEVTYRTGVGTAVREITAATDGSTVEVDMPSARDPIPFVTISYLNSAGKPVGVARYALADVVALISGHKQLPRVKKAKK